MLTIVCRIIVCFSIKFNTMEKYEINIRIGNKIREERQRQSLSQEKLAEIANVHRTYIGMIERAEKNITLVSLEKIAIALGLDIRDLLD
ncbi:helix-turn-helix domain-containing protein [Helicobacter didelphidarum]|nr:helix-turn-helix transcriptional regulator [Helicobacter didelphidarum]